MKNCICTNDKDFPSELPLSKRPKLNKEYTIVRMDKLNGDGGKYGVQLAEIDLSACAPYLYFSANRFAPLNDNKDLEVEKTEELFELA